MLGAAIRDQFKGQGVARTLFNRRGIAGARRLGWRAAALLCGLSMGAVVGVAAESPAASKGADPTTAHACFLPGLAPGSGKSATADDLLAVYNARASLIQTLEVSAMLRVKAGAEYGPQARAPRPFPAMIDVSAPASLRLIGVVPFSGRRTFDISSDGRELRLLVPDRDRMRLMAGPVDAPPTSSNPRENIRPQPLIDALRWPPGMLPHAPKSVRAGGKGVRIMALDLAPEERGSARTAQVEFDVNRGVVPRVTIEVTSQRSPTEIDFSDWQEWANSNGSASTCFPKRILVSQPQQHLELEMKVISVQVNPQIPASKFQMTAPAGIPVTRMSAPASTTHP